MDQIYAPAASNFRLVLASLVSGVLALFTPTQTQAALEFSPSSEAGGPPVWAFIILVGGGSGGDEAVLGRYTDGTETAFSAGDGAFLGGGIRWSPFQHEEVVAVGLAFDLGWKTTGIYGSNAWVELTRVPATLSVRASWFLAPTFALLGGGGVVAEFSPHVLASGVYPSWDERGDTSVGGALHAGLTYQALPFLGVELSAEARFIALQLPSAGWNASSYGIQCGPYIFF